MTIVSEGRSEHAKAEATRGRGARQVGIDAATRVLWILVGCALLNWSIQILAASTTFIWAGVLVVGCAAWGLLTVGVGCLPASVLHWNAGWRAWFEWTTALLVVVAIVGWAVVQMHLSPGYGTDELAFDQYAAQLATHGLNPYVHSMAPAFPLFQVSPDGFTYTLAGKAITSLSYPALSFEVYMPLLAAGVSTQLAVIVNVAAWAATVLLLFTLLPRSLRPAGLLIGSIAVYIAYAIGGITDVVYMPLLAIAAYRWDRFGESRRSYAAPIALGLAMAVKQTPWLLLPFVIVGLVRDRQRDGDLRSGLVRGGRYLGVTLAAFAIPNVPYLLASPSGWLSGVLTPVGRNLVPAGQGLIGLSLFAKLGGGSLIGFTAATVLLGVMLLVIYAGTYPRMRRATYLLPAVVMFFASRSYGNYLVSLLPMVLLGAVTVRETGGRASRGSRSFDGRWHSRSWHAAGVASATAFVAAVAYSLLSTPALALQVESIRTTGQLETIQQINLLVRNRSSSTLKPAFTINEGGAVTTFWLVSHGPRQLRPHASAVYTIVSPNFQAQPSIAGGFSILAFTSSPASVATSGPYIPSTTHVALVPAAINHRVAVGRRLVIHAQLLNSLNHPVEEAGIPVFLGQVIYDQGGLILSEAQVNDAPPGQTPVAAHTNSAGVATFTIIGTQGDSEPVYFEANLVNSTGFYPYGYSNIVPVRFESTR